MCSTAADRKVCSTQHDTRVEQSSRDAGGDSDQFPLPIENLDLSGAGELGQVDGASAANTGGIGFIGGDAREMRKELAGMNEEIVQGSLWESKAPAIRNGFLTAASRRFGMTS